MPKNSEVHYRRLFEAAQDGILILNAETGIISDVNPYLTKMLGYSDDELVQKRLWKVSAFNDVIANRDAFMMLGANEYVRYEDLPLKTKDGQRIRVEIVSNVYRVGDQKMLQIHIRDVTQRKQIESELRKNEESYRSLIEQASVGIFVSDATGKYIEVNAKACEMLGYTRAELLEKKAGDLLPAEDKTKNPPKFDELRAGKVIVAERRLIRKDGSLLPVEISGKMLSDGRIQGIVRDITERKRTEEMRAKLSAIVDTTNDVVMGTASGVIVSWNLNAEYLYGYSAEEAIGQPVSIVIPPDRFSEFTEIVARLKRGEHIKNFETVRMRKDGTLVDVSLSITPIKNDAGQFENTSTIARDISERKHIEVMRAHLAAIVQSSDDAIIGKTPDGVITSWNLGAERLYNYSAEEVIGQSISILIPPDRPDELPEIMAQLKRGESIKHFETVRLRKDGTRLDVSLTISPIKDALGQIIGASTIARDISERKQAEKSLKDSQQLFYGIFHASPTAIVLSRLSDGRFVQANQNFSKLTGYSLEEVIGLTSTEAGITVDPKVREERLAALKRDEALPSFEVEVVRKSGEIRTGLTTAGVVTINEQEFALSIFVDITERKHAEQALRINEERLKLALSATRTGVWEWDAQTNQVFWSPECYDIVKMDLSTKKTFESFLKFIHPEDLERVNTNIQRSLTQKEPFNVEFRVLTPDGETLWLQDIGRAEFDADGTVRGMIGTVSDISVRKKSEELLREGDNRLRALLENSADAITLVDANGIVIYDSPAAPGMLGYTPGDLIGQNVFTLIHPDDLPETRVLFENLAKRPGARLNSIFRVHHRNGSWIWIEIVATNLLSQAGVNAIVLNYRDITKRKLADERLRSAGEFLQSVQDALSAHIAILDQDGIIVQVNAAWRDFGIQNGLIHPNFCIGMNYLEICDQASGTFAEEATMMAKAIRDVMQNKQHETWVEYPCHAPGEERWFIARITSFENNGQKWIVISHASITERKQAEEKTKRKIEHLTALTAIDRAITSNFDLKLNLSEILSHVTTQLGVDAADIFLLNAYTLEFGAEVGFRNKAIRRVQIRLPDGYTGRTVMDGKAIHITDLRDPSTSSFIEPHWVDEDFTCYYAVPLTTKGQVKGVLEVFHRKTLETDREWLDLLNTLAGQAAIAIENATLFSSLQRSNAELVMAYDATIEGWSRALDLRDKETEGHSLRVTQMTLKLARALGLNNDQLAQIRWGALLHDIGKMGVPDGILLKPGPLTDDEWIIMKKHPTFAYEMLSPIHYLRHALDIPYCHHEKWDGSGYPRGLKGTQIPLPARIFAIVDVWDALKSDRPYRAGWSDEKVREHILSSSGSHFDPQVVNAFTEILKLEIER